MNPLNGGILRNCQVSIIFNNLSINFYYLLRFSLALKAFLIENEGKEKIEGGL